MILNPGRSREISSLNPNRKAQPRRKCLVNSKRSLLEREVQPCCHCHPCGQRWREMGPEQLRFALSLCNLMSTLSLVQVGSALQLQSIEQFLIRLIAQVYFFIFGLQGTLSFHKTMARQNGYFMCSKPWPDRGICSRRSQTTSLIMKNSQVPTGPVLTEWEHSIQRTTL